MKLQLICFLLLSHGLFAQQNAVVSMITVNDGLSQGMIFDILQSRDGFIWIATRDGLNRYDGSRFKVFSPDPFDPFSIGNSEARSLFEDSRGRIWVALPDGLDVYDPVSGRFFHVQHEGKPIVRRFGANLAETPDGAIWLADIDRIWKYSIQPDLLEKALKKGEAQLELPGKAIPLPSAGPWSGEPLRETSRLLFTQHQKLLVGTTHGVWSLDPGSEKMALAGLPASYIEGITQDPAGRIWVYYCGDQLVFSELEVRQVAVWDEQAGVRQEHIVPGRRNFLYVDPAGYVWTVQDKTLKKFQPGRFLNNGAADIEWPYEKFLGPHEGFNIPHVYMDRSGMLWARTNGFGVFKINLQNPTFKSYLPKTTQRRIYEDTRGNLIALTDIHVQYTSTRFDRSEPNRSFTAFPYPSAYGSYLAFDAGGNCWTSDPFLEPVLYRVDARSKERKAFPWKALGLCFDKNGKLLGVSEEGLHQFDPATEQSRFFPFQARLQRRSEFSHFLWKDSEDAMWVFGFEGLVKAVPTDAGYRFEYFVNNPADRSSLSSNTVLSVADDPIEPHRYLWVGTKGGGLNRLDKKTGQFKQYKTAQGLPDMVIYGVLAENAGPFIWLSTNKGLCRFDVRAETTKNFTVADGLQDNEFNSSSYLKMRDGTMIFGGIKGLTVFHPDSLRFNEHVPLTHIVGLQVNNQPFDISGKSSITLSHEQNLLNFDFAALEFTNPSQNQYRYQLVGVDEGWVSLGTKNSIQFAKLAPGDYTFKVLGSNNDGKWSEQPAEFKFTILPPWWASWWAYLVYLALAVAAFGAYYRYQLRQKLAHQEAVRLQELDDFKSRFFTNITHEFRTPLTVMLGMSEQLAKEEKDEPKRNKLGLIKRSGENLLRLVNQILDLAKLESNALKINYIHGDILAFIRYIAESLHSLANAQNLILRVDSDQAKILMDYDPERLLQIVHNLLSNAVKFTPSGGKVLLEASIKDNKLHLIVTDSGRGIPEAELPFLFDRFFQAKNQEYVKAGGTGIGLSLTKEIVKALGGEISVESVVGKGSSFKVILPITNKAVFANADPKLGMGAWDSGIIKQDESGIMDQPLDLNLPQILLIEDNPDVVEYLSACLKGKYSLDFAFNGRAGIENALVQIPDLIISDVMMPEKDGFEVVDTLKNNELTSHVPIILLTAKADMDSKLTGLRRGADAYLFKPFYQEELLVTIHNLLESRRKLQLKYQEQLLIKDGASPSIENSDTEDAFLLKFRALVEKHISDSDFEMLHIERGLSMSRSQIYRKIKALTDKSPSLLIRSIRLHHGRHLLLTTQLTVSEIAYQVGYSGINNFSDAYLEEFGERPMKTRGS